MLNLTSGGLSGGYRKYLQAMVPLLRADRRVDLLSVFIPPNAQRAKPGAEAFTWPEGDGRTGFRHLRRRLLEMAPDVVFIPTARWLDCGASPVVVMVRNMEPLLVPLEGNSLAAKAKNLARALSARRACRRATRIIAVSEHVKDFLTGPWQIPAARVGVVPHGAEAKLRPEEMVRPASLELASGEFIFTAGSIRPARGLRDIVEAAARIKKRGLPHHIVLAGAPDPDSEAYAAEMRRLAARLGTADRICWAGQLQPGEMAWCLANCAAFVMTSRAEACPNTVLEALSYGCLSVSTDQPPMPEFFGESAYYYRARDGEALAGRLVEALNAPLAERQAKRDAAATRARCYDWKTTAERTLEELEMAASSEKGR